MMNCSRMQTIGKTLRRAALAAVLLAGTAARAHEMKQGQGVQSVDVTADAGRLSVLTVEYDVADRPSIRLSSSADQGESFSTPARVDAGRPVIAYANRGNDVPLAVSGDHVVALWPTKGTGYMGSGPIVASISDDGGKTWRKGGNPSDDGTTTGHRFLAATADSSGVFHAVWLDNRTKTQALYYARSADGGKTWSRNVMVDSATCDCCWNHVATAPDGRLYILYRGKAPRDMALAVSADGGKTWARHLGIGGFGWNINICPHCGGGLALSTDGDRVTTHVLVYNGKEDAQGLYYLNSADDGATWSAPRRVGGASARHGDLAISPDGRHLLAVWESDGVSAASSDDGGKTWSEPKKLSSDARASHPRVVGFAGKFRVHWTEQPADKAAVLKTALVPVENSKT
jgi:hypothetical protein